ncbi:MAG TPA: DUF5985 family protein [Caulobacteraceae bacterium]|jgi:hypothetical protein|nr:DUF5985 family protein [Caulobacteraceae bacterium]
MKDLAPVAVYCLCLATSLLCAVLLARSWRRSRSGLLFWTALCFVFLTINNALLVVDLLIVPQTDLSPYRQATSLLAVGVLLFGFVKEAN